MDGTLAADAISEYDRNDQTAAGGARDNGRVSQPRPPLPLPSVSDEMIALRPWEASDVRVLLAAGQDAVITRFRYSLPRSGEEALGWLRAVESDRLACE